jgi:hypothetical protein
MIGYVEMVDVLGREMSYPGTPWGHVVHGLVK